MVAAQGLGRTPRMIAGLVLLALLAAAGEGLARALSAPVPGPILGLLMLLLLRALCPGAAGPLGLAARGLLPLLGLFILPLAVEAVGLMAEMPPGVLLRLVAMLLASTLATGVVTALLLARLSPRDD